MVSVRARIAPARVPCRFVIRTWIMDRYTAKRSMLGNQPIVALADGTGHRARIACHGAALLDLHVPRGGSTFDIAWGYRDAAEIDARKGSHFAILAPFGGRIGDARYRFDGCEYDLEPGVEGSAREFRHGFVRGVDFEIAQLRADDTAARCTLATSAIRPRPGYPFSIDLAVTFTLAAAGLTLEARMHNVGDRPAPCFFGWHAYFRAGDGMADDWMLEIPARTTIRTDRRLIALPGDAAYVSLDDAPALDFREPRGIAGAVLDNGYTDLARDDDGRIRTRLTDPADAFSVTVWQERGVMHAFTGDTLGAGARSAVALEPMEFMADGFNRPECADGIRLEAGAERIYRCGVEFVAR
jgi:aldose 1-epimerase